MSYNIMGKNASFKGDISGTIENQVNDWDNQSISGNKTFTAAITSSADVMLSGSGKVSASFFYGDGTGLSGVGGTPGGLDREVQFNDSSAFGASTNFKFTAANELQVTGEISASLGVSGSEFHGDGSNLTAVTASFVTASNVNGILNASQVNIGEGLEANANAIRVKLTAANSGLNLAPAGVSLNINNLNTKSGYTNTDKIAVYNGATTENLQLSVLEAGLDIDGGQISGLNSISTDVLPVNITASGHVSASAFFGDGSALEGVTASPTPAGANTQIQFNDGGALGGDADLTFIKGTNTLATTIVSASAHVSASEFAGVAGTLIDSAGNFAGNNASFAEITASSEISSSADIFGLNFRGNGSTLNNVPLGSSNASSVVFVNNYNNQTITTNADFKFDGTDVLNNGGGFKGVSLSASADLEVGGHITGSGDIKLLNGNLYLASGGKLFFDGDDGGAAIDVSISEHGTNKLLLDGNNQVVIRQDEYFVIQDENNNNRFTADVRTSAAVNKISTDLAISSSAAISSSLIHLQEGINIAGETILNNQGNIVGTSATAVITIADNPTTNDTISFGDSTITPVVVSTYNTRGADPDIAIGMTAAATRTNTKNRLESLHNVSVTIDGDDLIITNNNLGLIGNRAISETFTSVNNTVSGFTGGYSIDIYANDITASSFSSPNGTLISAEGDFQGNNASFNEITASSVISSSAEISASSFHGDGSALTGISTSTYYYLHNPDFALSFDQTVNYIGLSGFGNKGGGSREMFFVAPASGSVARVMAFSPKNAASGSLPSTTCINEGDTYIFYYNVNAVEGTSGFPTGRIPTAHVTSSAANLQAVNYRYGGTGGAGSFTEEKRFKLIIDLENNNPTVSGSNSFDPGDVLIFGMRANDSNSAASEQAITIVLKLEEPYTYP